MHVKWIPVLAVLLGAQVALAVTMELRADRLAPAKPDTPLVATDLGPVDRISIDGPVAPEPASSVTVPAQLAPGSHHSSDCAMSK